MSLADSSKKTEQTVSSLNQSMKELSQSKAGGKDYYDAFKKAAEVFKQTYDVIDGAISRVAELGNKARELGTSAEFLQQMQYAAKKTVTDMGAVEASFQNMWKVVDQASLGNEQMAMSLAELGLEYKNLARLSPDDQFREIVDALSDVDDENERARLGTAILGDEYKKITGFIGDFTEKAKEASESIDFIDEKTVSEAQKYKDSFENPGKIFDKIVASNLTEYLASASDCFAELYDFSVKTGQGLWLMVDVLRDAILEVVRLSDKVFDTNFAAQLSEKWSTYLPYSAWPATREEVNDARRRVEAQRKKDEERRRLDEEKGKNVVRCHLVLLLSARKRRRRMSETRLHVKPCRLRRIGRGRWRRRSGDIWMPTRRCWTPRRSWALSRTEWRRREPESWPKRTLRASSRSWTRSASRRARADASTDLTSGTP